ncbi:hypothetical protein SDC9_39017 [bioreactor metagenome]|uniref:Uncharacterized protein n=1 Tax=bioreactor metagenome TaxID=1076179 RepID=A0A644VR39_9ZZZZ
MAEQHLDCAQIGATLQQMRGEGVAQHMRRDPRRADPRGDRDVLEQPVKALPGQVAFPCARGEEKARGRNAPAQPRLFLGRVAAAQPVGERRTGGRAERHHPFLAALAADQKHRRIAARRRDRQRDKLAHPHAGGIEQFHQAAVADLLGERLALIARRLEQRLDLFERERLRQPLRLARAGDAQRRVVGAPAFLIGEAEELPDRREPPRARRFRQPLGLAAHEVILDRLAPERRKGQIPRLDEAEEVGQVATIAQDRVARRAGLGCLRLEKGGDPACVRRGAHPLRSRITISSAARRATSSSPFSRIRSSPLSTRR